MPHFKTSTEWYEQSSLLLKACPTTVGCPIKPAINRRLKVSQTRITSKYTVLKPTPSKIKKRQKYLEKKAAKPNASSRSSSPPPQAPNPEEPTVTFVLKTYDPDSGTCLQYETGKAAEVGRLIGSLGRLGRHMAALPEIAEDLTAPAEGAGVSTPKVEEEVKPGGAPTEQKTGKKKKKGKK